MLESNFEVLSTRKLSPSAMCKRLAYLEHAATMLREYHKRCSKIKVNKIQALIIQYETLSENLRMKLDNGKGV